MNILESKVFTCVPCLDAYSIQFMRGIPVQLWTPWLAMALFMQDQHYSHNSLYFGSFPPRDSVLFGLKVRKTTQPAESQTRVSQT